MFYLITERDVLLARNGNDKVYTRSLITGQRGEYSQGEVSRRLKKAKWDITRNKTVSRAYVVLFKKQEEIWKEIGTILPHTELP